MTVAEIINLIETEGLHKDNVAELTSQVLRAVCKDKHVDAVEEFILHLNTILNILGGSEKTMEPSEEIIPDGLPGLTVGRCCHYVAYNGTHLAAMVVGFDQHTSYSTVDLAVFTSMPNINGKKNFGLQFHQDVEYSEEPRPGTWHWIEA